MPPSSASLRRLLALSRPYLSPLVVATALMLVGSAVALVAPWVAGRVVDAAVLEHSAVELDRVVFLLVGLFALMGLVAFLQISLLRSVGARLVADLRRRLFSRLVTLGPEFYEAERVGELLSRLGADLQVVREALLGELPAGTQAILRFVAVAVILFVLQPHLTVVALLVVPPVILVAVAFGKRLERVSTRVQDALADSSAVAEETLSGVRTVQAFARERHSMGRYESVLARLVGTEIVGARLQGGFAGTTLFAAFSAFALVLWRGGHLMIDGRLTPGELTAFLLYTFSIAASVGELGSLYGATRELKGASVRIFSLLDARPSVVDAPAAAPLEHPEGRIAFEGVVFSYRSSKGRRAVDGLSFEIAPGELVGVVGPSGAGKSTLFSLLLRFHDPSAGRIRIDGRDLREVPLGDLRRAIGIVPQEIFLFGGTVEQNLLFGRPEASREEVRQAAEAAGADEFVRRLPHGYQEIVGERGVKLSAGQRQRIAIARAFLKDPAVLLLDEATSHLDPESEETVQQALAKLLRGRTTLVIAHRLATALQADRILLLDEGRLVASGTHESLYPSSGLYRRYWELQSLPANTLPPGAA